MINYKNLSIDRGDKIEVVLVETKSKRRHILNGIIIKIVKKRIFVLNKNRFMNFQFDFPIDFPSLKNIQIIKKKAVKNRRKKLNFLLKKIK